MLTGLELSPSRFDRPRQTMQSVGLASETDRHPFNVLTGGQVSDISLDLSLQGFHGCLGRGSLANVKHVWFVNDQSCLIILFFFPPLMPCAG